MQTVAFLNVLCSHLLASLPFWASIRQGKFPSTASFACLSVIFYYDFGLALELLGYTTESVYFTSLLEADTGRFLLAMMFIGAAPWLFHLGSAITSGKYIAVSQTQTSTIPKNKYIVFSLLTIIGGLPLMFLSLRPLLQGHPIWVARAEIGRQFGPLIVLLYLPLYTLAFYVRQSNSRTFWGLIFSCTLAVMAVLSTVGIGQRTTMLLPFLILGLFRFRINLTKMFVFMSSLMLLAALLLPLFKWQYADKNAGIDERIAQTIAGDVSRSNVLHKALELSEPIGTRVAPYPMAGYVYSLLFFVPRSLAPFKGASTAQYFTGYVVGTKPEETTWGFGVGVIEELLINIGATMVVPGLCIYGLVMGVLDRASQRVPALVVPSRLGAIWLCGYHLPAILLMFGAMAIVGIVLDAVFVKNLYILNAPKRTDPTMVYS